MYANAPQNTDDYIRILKGLDNREKLKIISALTDSMLEPLEEIKEESMEEFLNSLSAWRDDGESYEETVDKIRNARCQGETRHLMEW